MLAIHGLKGAILAATASGALLVSVQVNSAYADQYASPARASAAVGHYARARALLVEALAEFEAGRRLARPDRLLDSEQWRSSVVSRTEDLNRVLDPKPRVSRDGVRYKASPSLIRRERDRLPRPLDGARDANYYGEDQRNSEIEAARARIQQPQAPVENAHSNSERLKDMLPKAFDNSLRDEAARSILEDQRSQPSAPAALAPAPAAQPAEAVQPSVAAAQPASAAASGDLAELDEDPEVAKAIQDAINERLQKLSQAVEANQ